MILKLLPNFPDKNIFRRGKFNLFSSLLEKFTFLILFLYIAKNYSQREFGLVVLSFNIYNILSSLFDLGLPAFCQREAARDPKIFTQIIQLLEIKCILFLPFIFLGLLLIEANGFSDYILIFTAGVAVYLFSFIDIPIKLLQGRNEYSQIFKYHAAARVLFLILFCAVLIFKMKSLHLIVFLIISLLFQTAMLLSQFYRPDLKNGDGINIAFIKSILNSSIPIWLGSVFVWGSNKIDIVLIQKYLDYNSVALYAAAYSIYQFPQIFFGIFLSPLFTDLSKKYRMHMKIELREILNYMLFPLLICTVFILIYCAASEAILEIMFGEKYVKSGPVLRILSIAVIPLFMNNITGIALNAAGKEKYQMAGAFAGLIINVALNLFFLARYSIAAAAMATVAAELIVFLVQYVFILHHNINIEKKIAVMIISCK